MATTVLEKARMKTAVGRECVKGSRAGGNKSMKRTLSSSFRSYAVGKSPRNQDCGPTTSRTSLDAASNHVEGKGRRQSLLLAGSVVTLLLDKDTASLAAEGEFENSMEALKGKDYGKSKMRFSDYTLTESGLQYQDIRTGTGPSPKQGEEVVVDWDGYTIGYYGRIFEARNKPKGSSFEGNDRGYFRFHVGQDEVSQLQTTIRKIFKRTLLSSRRG